MQINLFFQWKLQKSASTKNKPIPYEYVWNSVGLMIWPSRVSESHNSVGVLKTLLFSALNAVLSAKNLLKTLIVSTTDNHCYCSRRDRTMSISSLSQVTCMIPISILVLCNNRCCIWWAPCMTTNDKDAFFCVGRCIAFNSLTCYYLRYGWKSTKPVAIREWIVSSLSPFCAFII